VTYRLKIKPPALRDIQVIRRDYEAVSPELARRFDAEILRALEQIESMPTIYARVHRNCQQVSLRRFPQVITYLIDGETVVVIAVMHCHRDPALWKRRTEP